MGCGAVKATTLCSWRWKATTDHRSENVKFLIQRRAPADCENGTKFRRTVVWIPRVFRNETQRRGGTLNGNRFCDDTKVQPRTASLDGNASVQAAVFFSLASSQRNGRFLELLSAYARFGRQHFKVTPTPRLKIFYSCNTEILKLYRNVFFASNGYHSCFSQ
jgi:hypothetical protein